MSEQFEMRLWATLTGGILANLLNGPLSVRFFIAMFAYAALSTWWVNYRQKRDKKLADLRNRTS